MKKKTPPKWKLQNYFSLDLAELLSGLAVGATWALFTALALVLIDDKAQMSAIRIVG